MQLENVALVGLGAVGAAYATRLASLPGFFVFAGGPRAGRIEKGVLVNGALFTPPVKTPETAPKADFIIFSVKDGQLEEAMQQAACLVKEGTIVLSLLNGIYSEEQLKQAYPAAHVLYGFTVGIDAVRDEGGVRFSTPGKIVFGEKNNLHTPQTAAVEQLLQKADIPCLVPEDILYEQWWKLLINVGINQCSAILGAPYGFFMEDETARAMLLRAQREVLPVAQAEGINLTEEDITRWMALLPTMDPAAKTSMLQDRQAGRPTEARLFGGAISALGKKHGIPTPVNNWLYEQLK